MKEGREDGVVREVVVRGWFIFRSFSVRIRSVDALQLS
jgi:hypothetical protein